MIDINFCHLNDPIFGRPFRLVSFEVWETFSLNINNQTLIISENTLRMCMKCKIFLFFANNMRCKSLCTNLWSRFWTDKHVLDWTLYDHLIGFSFLFLTIYNRFHIVVQNRNDTCWKRSTIATCLQLLYWLFE